MFIYIYKLIKKGAVNDDMVYIGSTEDIIRRLKSHISRCNNSNSPKYNLKVYKYIRENGGFDEWDMLIIDEIEVPLKKCEHRDKCENEYIKKYDAINKLNSIGLCFNKKKWDNENKLKNNESKYNYYYKNYEYYKEKINCDICGRLGRRQDLARHKKTNYCINFKNLAI
jgi:hypothetical protein